MNYCGLNPKNRNNLHNIKISYLTVCLMNKRNAQDISDKIVEVLKRERIRQNISQYKMAKDTGLSKSSILYIERLEQKPALYTLIIIAQYLDISLGKLMLEIEEDYKTQK